MLEQARDVFDRKLYLVCVAALLPILDGLAHRAWDREFHRKRRRKKFFDEKMATAEPNTATFYLWRSTRVFVETVFADADFASDTHPNILNRHWVVHGLGLPTGSRMDCVRLLQGIHSFENLVADP